MSTHFEPHRFGVGDAQLDEQVGVPVVVEQSPSGAVQAVVQLPQVCGRVRSVSQPSSGFDEQWPNPLTQAAGCSTQAPATHWTAGETAVVFTFGKAAQLCPQAPQFLTSVMRFTHCVEHRFGVDPLQLGRQLAGCVCSEQMGVDPLHVSEQLPQWADVLSEASQPSSGWVEQWANPEVQADGGT